MSTTPTTAVSEQQRLAALHSYAVLDTPAESDFDDLVALASQICGTPMALISLVDTNRQWFKARVGVAAPETAREISFCTHAIQQPDVFIVEDATKDTRFKSSPLVTGEPGIRFYAGAPLFAPRGEAIGSLCVMDRQPRQLTKEQQKALQTLSRHVVTQLELRRQTKEMARNNGALLNILEDQRLIESALRRSEAGLAQERNLLRTLIDNLPGFIYIKDTAGRHLACNRATAQVFGVASEAEVCGTTVFDFFPPEVAREYDADDRQVIDSGKPLIDREQPYVLRNDRGWYSTTKIPLRDANGAITGLVGITVDITERKKLEARTAALSALGQKLSSAQTAIAAGEIIITVAEELFGWDACFLDLFSPDTGLLKRVLNRDTINGEKVDCPATQYQEQPSPFIRKILDEGAQLILKEPPFTMLSTGAPFGDMNRPSASIMAVPMRDRDRVIGTLSIQSYTPQAYSQKDLALLQSLADHCGGALERIRAEEKERSTFNQLQQLLAHSPAVIYSLRVEGSQVVPKLASANITQLLGFTVQEVLQRDWWFRQVHVEDLDRAVAGLQELLAAGSTSRQFRVRHKDGHYLWVEDNQRLIRDASGQPFEVAGVWTDITARMQAEEALRDSEARFRQFAEQIEDVFWSTTPDYHTVNYISPAYEKIWGRSLQSIYAHPGEWIEAILPDDRPRVIAALEHLAKGGPYDIEFRIQRPDGSIRCILDHGFCLRNPAGEIYRTIGVARDITERKRTEDELRWRTAFFEAQADSSIDGILVVDGHGNKVLQNRRFSELWKIPEHLILEKDDTGQLQYATNRTRNPQQFLERVQYLYSHPDEVSREEIELVDGTVLDRYSAPVRSQQGEYYGRIWTFRDMTERKQAAENLRATEERFRQLAENINEVFWMTDPSKQAMLYISPAYERIWGRTCESLYRTPGSWVESIHPDDRQRVLESARTKQALGKYDEVYRIQRPDGTERWIHDRAYPIRNAAGEVYRVVGTAEDVTQQQNLERQLRQAQKMEAIGTLAGGIAHDFNNILGAINGFTELAKLDAAGHPALQEFLDEISKAGARAADLVRQILSFSRQQEQQRKPVQLRHVVNEAFKLLRATIPSTIQFNLSLSPDAPTVLADATQIHQIVMNLGTNASHAMRERPGQLSAILEPFLADAELAAAHPDLRPGRYARLTVSDTGCGMDRATLERIFEPFFTTKAPGEGTGLGLAVVHGIMQAHDGCITAYSQPGEGTSFRLYFPAFASESADAAPGESSVPVGRGECILLVDDEESLVKLCKKVLERLGYTVDATTSPNEALDAVRKHPQKYHLAITDLTMPGMTGVDLARQLHQLRPGLPIILATGYSASLTATSVHALGIRELLMKPLTRQSLGDAVHRVLTAKSPT